MPFLTQPHMEYTLSLKTHRPAPPIARVTRPTILQRLTVGLESGCPMTLVSAPAGFGKTTCLAEWLASVPHPIAWISLDENDQDPGRFFSVLGDTLQLTGKAAGPEYFANIGQIVRILRSGQIPPVQAISAALISDILAFPQRFLLVLDDFHLIQDRFILEVFENLLSNLFQTSATQPLHLVLSGREDPPIPLARLRASNRLTEIRAEDLRFSSAEAGQLLNEIIGLNLSSQDISTLQDRTEGWPAGLQLAGLSLRGHANPTAFVRSLSGSQRFILNYLTEEVLNRQSEEMKQFLLETAILDRLCGDLCNAVTLRQDSQLLLEQMVSSNLFLFPLDEAQHWYRYHHLFADLLRNRASILQPEITAKLHLRAAGWFEQAASSAVSSRDRAALISAGIRHALAAEDHAAAVRFIETHALVMLDQWYAGAIETWLQALPASWRMKSPKTSLAFARMYLMRGDFFQAGPYLERLKAFFANPSAEESSAITPALQAEWMTLQASLLLGQKQPQAALQLASQALEIAPPDNLRVLCQVYLYIANAYQQMNDNPHAEEAFQRLIQLGRAASDPVTELWVVSALALMLIEQGYLHRGYDLAMQGAERMERSEIMSPIGAGIYGELGQISFHWHRLGETERYLRMSAELSALVGFSDSEIYYAVSLSRLALLRGDIEDAARDIRQAEAKMRADSPAIIREEVITQQITVHLAQGNFSTAEHIFLQEMALIQGSYDYPRLSPDQDIPYQQGLLYLTGLRLHLFRARHRETIPSVPLAQSIATWSELAGTLLVIFRKRNYVPLILQILVLQAQFHAATQRMDAALADLDTALNLAEPEGYLSDFVIEGTPLAELLAASLQRSQPGSTRAAYIKKILELFPMPMSSKSEWTPKEQNSITSDLVEPLTTRELEVLRLVAKGQTYDEIAGQLVVSINTIRTHIKAIYRKLEADNRTEAIQIARDRLLL